MNSDIFYRPLSVYEEILNPLILNIQRKESKLVIPTIDNMYLGNFEENNRLELLESLSNSIYPLYFCIEMPEVFYEEFKQLFRENKNKYKKMYGDYIFLEVPNRNNLKIIIKELAWINGSGYRILWSTNREAFHSSIDNNFIKIEDNQTIFMIAEPEDSLVILSTEERFSSYKNFKILLPSFLETTLYDYE